MIRFYPRVLGHWRKSQTGAEKQHHIVELFLLLILLIGVHVVLMMVLEGLAPGDAVWLTLTTVTTVGYGDQVAITPGGRIATVVLLYIFGIFLLSQIVGEWIDHRFDRRERIRKGFWRWKMNNHIVILNTPDIRGDRYLRLLVEQIRDTPTLERLSIQVFSSSFPDGLPRDITGMNVALRSGIPEERVPLDEMDVEQAKFILLLAVDSNALRSDSINLDLLDQLAEYKLTGLVVAECVLDSNRARLKKNGADAVLRPVRAYPELIVRTMSAPGTEEIMEDLFVHAGNHPCRYDVAFENRLWGDLAGALLASGLGTALGYLDAGDRVVTNPAPDARVSGRALFLMVRQHAALEPGLVAECIAGATSC